MATLNNLLTDLGELNKKIAVIAKKYGYVYEDDFGALEYDDNDPDQHFMESELREVLDNLAQAHASIQYLRTPIEHTGPLTKDENGRYCCGNRTYTSGSSIELMVPALNRDGDSVEAWRSGRIEYSSKRGDYYFVQDPEISLEGRLARYREYRSPEAFY